MHRNLGIGSWIARRARMAPDRVAWIFEDRSWTYGELDDRITRLARALDERGVGAGDRVAFLGHNHPAALETLFACGLLGAVAVPLHPGFDERSLIQVLRDAEPAAVIATRGLVPAVQRIRKTVRIPRCFGVDTVAGADELYEALVESASDEPVDRPVGLDDLCLLAFSSGTTGPNKGVRLTHGNLFFNAVNLLTCIDYVQDDVTLTSAPLYRMGGLGFSLTMLLKGGTLVLQKRSDPEESLRLVARHRVTALFDAVGALEAMRDCPSFDTADLSSLRICITGGSQVPARLVADYRRRGICLQPGYGLTEASPVALLVAREEVAAHPGASGRPPLLCAVRVVDDELEDVPPGEVGELLVHGPNVMDGYWRAPDRTARAIVDGWLRTGDAARATADGMVTVVGRLSDALLLGGRRVHPGDLEEHLRGRDDVLDCAIVQDRPEGTPIAFVVPRPARAADRESVRAACRARLGHDAQVQVVRELPRNPNGKILRAQLRGTVSGPRQPPDGAVPLRTGAPARR